MKFVRFMLRMMFNKGQWRSEKVSAPAGRSCRFNFRSSNKVAQDFVLIIFLFARVLFFRFNVVMVEVIGRESKI